MGSGGTLAQHGVSPFWHLLHLHTWHNADDGAIRAETQSRTLGQETLSWTWEL